MTPKAIGCMMNYYSCEKLLPLLAGSTLHTDFKSIWKFFMRLVRRLTDFRSDYRDSISLWSLFIFQGRFHSSLSAYRLFEIALRRHNYSRAELICALSRQRFGLVPDVLTMSCILSIKAGDLDSGFVQLAECLRRSDFRAVERLLFRTGSRPDDLSKRFIVLDKISEHQDVLFSHRCYARIAQGYQVLKMQDFALAKKLEASLRLLIDELEGDPSVACCMEPNRRNRGKMIVSLCAVSYHVSLLLNDDSLLKYSWASAMNFLDNIDFSRSNPDACLRMSSNLSRCLVIGSLLVGFPQGKSPSEILRTLADFQLSVVQHCLPSQANRRHATQENHLLFMRDLQAQLRIALNGNHSELESSVARLAQLLNHSSSKSLTPLIQQRLFAVIG